MFQATFLLLLLLLLLLLEIQTFYEKPATPAPEFQSKSGLSYPYGS